MATFWFNNPPLEYASSSAAQPTQLRQQPLGIKWS